MLEKPGEISSCPLAYAVSTFSGKWKPFIIWHISMSENQTIRYGALRNTMPYKISHKMFIQHLRELEDDGIVKRTVFESSSTRQVEYSLTDKGRSLATILYMLRDWGSVYGDFSQAAIERTAGVLCDGRVIYHNPSINKSQRDLELGDIIWIANIDGLTRCADKVTQS